MELAALRTRRPKGNVRCEVLLEVWRNEATAHERLRVCTSVGEDRDATDRYQGYRFDPRSRRVVEAG